MCTCRTRARRRLIHLIRRAGVIASIAPAGPEGATWPTSTLSRSEPMILRQGDHVSDVRGAACIVSIRSRCRRSARRNKRTSRGRTAGAADMHDALAVAPTKLSGTDVRDRDFTAVGDGNVRTVSPLLPGRATWFNAELVCLLRGSVLAEDVGGHDGVACGEATVEHDGGAGDPCRAG